MKKRIEFTNPNITRVYELTLGYSCNSNCQFCSIDPLKRHINKTTVEALGDILQAKKEGFRMIGFGGGEPTIRKDIIKLVNFAKKMGFRTIRIQTNGIILTYLEFCKDLVSAGANFFKFSIHGHRAEIHDALTQVPGSFEKAVKGLENVRSLGVRTEINIVINKLNYKFLPQIVDFFSISRGLSSYVFIYPTYKGRMKDNAEKIGIPMTETIPFIKEAVDLAEAIQLDKSIIFNIPPCLIDQKYHKWLPGKNLNLKVNAPEYVQEDSLEGEALEKAKFKKCKKCSFSPYCNGIFNDYIDVFGLKEFE